MRHGYTGVGSLALLILLALGCGNSGSDGGTSEAVQGGAIDRASCATDVSLCPVCPDGAVSERCDCGGNPVESGFCCDGNVQATACPTAAVQCDTDDLACPLCGDGVIDSRCACGGTTSEFGYCCSGVHQMGACEVGEVLAFPGAEGFGARVSGGRGGNVLKVTTLSASGPGSLSEALATPGPRTIVFDVSGVINGDFDILHGDVTIAGQTAPGAGITILGRLWAPFTDEFGNSPVRNLIVRHLRVRHICRPGVPDNQCDTARLSSQSNFILDHVSLAWGVDETLDMWGGANVWTIQDSSFEHPCRDSAGSADHAFGVINRRGGRGSIIRTAMLTVRDRNPAFADGPIEIINMLVYNHQTGLVHHNPASGSFNVIGNVYRHGPAGGIGKPFFIGHNATGPTEPSYWFFDNYLDDIEGAPFGRFDDPWEADHPLLGEAGMGGLAVSHRAPAPFAYTGDPAYVEPSILPSEQVPERLLATAGAFPRDVVTRRAVDEARTRSGEFGCAIRRELDVEGNSASSPHPLMEGLDPLAAPVDRDGDGMPDDWELAAGLDPDDPEDQRSISTNGYTALENYINWRADRLVPRG